MFCVDCGLIFDRALPGDAFGAPAVQLPVFVDESGREHPIRPGINAIGREGDIQILDGRVSRRHAQATLDGETLTIEDLGSTNGTSVNESPLVPNESVLLNQGDAVSLGGLILKLNLPGAAHATAVVMTNKTASLLATPSIIESPATLVGNESEYPLKSGVNTFGRKAENDVSIVDPYVSGKHGTIEVSEEGVFITDTGSTNGTVLNDEKLTPNMRVKMEATDLIKLGSLEFSVQVKTVG